MSHHFNSFLMNDVLIKLEEQSFFADIGEERTPRFVQDAETSPPRKAAVSYGFISSCCRIHTREWRSACADTRRC